MISQTSVEAIPMNLFMGDPLVLQKDFFDHFSQLALDASLLFENRAIDQRRWNAYVLHGRDQQVTL